MQCSGSGLDAGRTRQSVGPATKAAAPCVCHAGAAAAAAAATSDRVRPVCFVQLRAGCELVTRLGCCLAEPRPHSTAQAGRSVLPPKAEGAGCCVCYAGAAAASKWCCQMQCSGSGLDAGRSGIASTDSDSSGVNYKPHRRRSEHRHRRKWFAPEWPTHGHSACQSVAAPRCCLAEPRPQHTPVATEGRRRWLLCVLCGCCSSEQMVLPDAR